MAMVALEIPPGVVRRGTELESAGRWYDTNLVRWNDQSLQPIGGWRDRTPSSTITGTPSSIFAYTDNNPHRHIAFGCESKLYALDQGFNLSDITPASMATGRAVSTNALGYGTRNFGEDEFGTPRPQTEDTGILDATSWSMDSWGAYLLACADTDGRLLQWTNTSVSAPLTNAPTSCKGLVVTDERFVFALGAGGEPRKVAWCDQEDATTWSALATNQAGDLTLATSGVIMCGRSVRGGTLILTTVDAHIAIYSGPPFVYGFERVGDGCGIVGPNAISATATMAVWMGVEGFFTFDGYARPLRCPVSEYVFSDINRNQLAKVSSWTNPLYKEIWFHYPSSGSTECDRYVIWNYLDDIWTIGVLDRSCGTGVGVLDVPVLATATGKIYEHEVGTAYLDLTGTAMSVYAESGPIQIGVGEQIAHARQLIPDERTLGDVTASFKTRMYPTGAESSHGPFTLTNPTPVRFAGRQAKVRIEGSASTDWRVGTLRVDVIGVGKR